MATVERHGNSWRAIYAGPDGKRVRESVPARNKAEAKELAARLERRAWLQRRGLEVTADDLTGTLADLCLWWLQNRCSIASREGERQRLQKHVMSAAVGALPLSQVRSSVIEDLLHRMEANGAAPGSVNKVRSLLHTAFARAKKAGRWAGENPVSETERRKVPKRVYMTLTPEQIQKMLEQVPEEWRPLFACGPALGLRKGELFALRKADVDLARGTISVCRSHERDTTKTATAAVLPIPTALRPWLERQLREAPGTLLFPAPDGSQRSREADPQKILRHALARAGIVEGYEHRCRWCKYSVRAADNECRYCPNCVKRTDGRGNPLIPPRGRMLWPKAIHVGMRFHDLRHGFATELLRRGVDVHRVQRLMRHSDIRVTTGTYGHLVVEDLRVAVDAHSPLRLPPGPSAPASKQPEIRQELGFSAPYEPQSSQKPGSAQTGEIVQAL